MKNTLIANGQRLAYYTSGPPQPAALPVVLLHGFCEESSLWEPLLPFLTDTWLLRIDLPGFGDSALPLTPGIDHYAAAVCMVLNELSIQRCVLFGHSMGGYTALAFAHHYPERLAGFSLIHSHPYADTPEQAENRRRGIELIQSGKKDLFVAQLFPNLFSADFAAQQPDVLDELIRKGQQQDPAGIIGGLQSMLERGPHLDTLKNSTCPVQFILGNLDPLNPLERALAAAALPNTADIRVLSGVAHMGMFEAPTRIATAIREFAALCK